MPLYVHVTSEGVTREHYTGSDQSAGELLRAASRTLLGHELPEKFIAEVDGQPDDGQTEQLNSDPEC